VRSLRAFLVSSIEPTTYCRSLPGLAYANHKTKNNNRGYRFCSSSVWSHLQSSSGRRTDFLGYLKRHTFVVSQTCSRSLPNQILCHFSDMVLMHSRRKMPITFVRRILDVFPVVSTQVREVPSHTQAALPDSIPWEYHLQSSIAVISRKPISSDSTPCQ
jgi:hypothetical protein